jgi:adenosyl cobinamide kinase/adenosyl cobinamide phosphate guanylyltransferase
VTRIKITQEIKGFISYLKLAGITQYTDDKNNYLYSIKDKIKMPIDMLKGLYNKEVGDSSYYENKNYILASLDNVVGFDFIPNGAKTSPTSISGLVKLNAYKSYNTTTSGGNDMTIWLEFLDRLFPDVKEQKVVFQYLAHIFQKPAQRPSWHLLLTSDTGTGKGFLFSDVLTPLLCSQTFQVSSFSDVTAKHSTCFDGTMLLMLDDATSMSHSTMTKIKSKLSETYISVERKNEQASMQKVYTRVILATNELRPLRLEANERRWFAPAYMKHRVDDTETQALIAELAYWLDDGGLDAVHEWFMSYSLEGFNHKSIYQTSTLKSMIENSVPVLVDQLKEWLEVNVVFTWSELKEEFNAADDLLKKYLVELHMVKKRIAIEGRTLTLWFSNGLNNGEVRSLYNPTTF